MEKMYSFTDNVINYTDKDIEIDVVFAYKNLYIAEEDILKIFNINLETLNRCIYQACNSVLNESEIRYVNTSSDRISKVYYSLEAINYLGFIKNDEQIIKFILWSNKTLRDMLIKAVKYQPRTYNKPVVSNVSFNYYRDAEYYINEINASSHQEEKTDDQEETLIKEEIYEDNTQIYDEIHGFQKTYYR